jgi:hypothetical protein
MKPVKPPKRRRLRAPVEPDLPEAGIGNDPRSALHKMRRHEAIDPASDDPGEYASWNIRSRSRGAHIGQSDDAGTPNEHHLHPTPRASCARKPGLHVPVQPFAGARQCRAKSWLTPFDNAQDRLEGKD